MGRDKVDIVFDNGTVKLIKIDDAHTPLQQENFQNKIRELQEQVQLLKTDKDEMFTLAQQMMACRPPANCYALFLHEKYWLFLFGKYSPRVKSHNRIPHAIVKESY